MTTLTIENNVELPKTNFQSIEELYFAIQKQISFEQELQEKALRWLEINESELIDL